MNTTKSWWRASSKLLSPPAHPIRQRSVTIRALRVALLVALMVPAARAACARPLAGSDVVFDLRPASDVLAMWPACGKGGVEAPRRIRASERRAALKLGQSPAHRALRGFIATENRCLLTDEDFARAITHPDSTLCGLSLQPAYADRDQLRALVAALRGRADSLRARVAAETSRYLPPADVWRPVRFWFVVSSRWSFDAVTLSPDQAGTVEPIVLINLTEVIGYGATTKERVETLAHVMAHEAFHSALRQREPVLAGWAKYPLTARSPLDYIARIMADEGVAHWIDWRERPGADSIFTSGKPGSREVKAFDQLALACRRLRDRTGDAGGRTEMLQMASNGPLWSKYGAISGMFAAYRIESRLGLDSLRTAVTGGPGEFLKMYGRVATADTLLKRVPASLSGG